MWILIIVVYTVCGHSNMKYIYVHIFIKDSLVSIMHTLSVTDHRHFGYCLWRTYSAEYWHHRSKWPSRLSATGSVAYYSHHTWLNCCVHLVPGMLWCNSWICLHDNELCRLSADSAYSAIDRCCPVVHQ